MVIYRDQFSSHYIWWELWDRQCSNTTTTRPRGSLIAGHKMTHKTSGMQALVAAQLGKVLQKHL